jgi:hypothetical protein
MPRNYPPNKPGPSLDKMARPVTEIKANKPDDVRKLKTANLTALAAEKGVDISALSTNAERAEAIIAVMFKGDE